MRPQLFFPLLLVVFSCSSTKKSDSNSKTTSVSKIETICQDNVDCSIEMLKNKRLKLQTDETGAMYYQIEEDSEKVVFRYQYKLKEDKTLADSGYLEELLFEVSANYGDFHFSGDEVQKTKMILNVMCFCRDKAGVHKISTGRISKVGNHLSITIPNVITNQKTNDLKILL